MPTVRYTTVNGEIIAEKRNGVRKEYVPDPLGSTVALLDNTQSQTDTFSYWPYGENRIQTGTTPTPFQFVGTQGYYQQSANDDVYVRARVLDTLSGRWLTQDPISFIGGDMNLFRYTGNKPVSVTDGSGYQAKITVIATCIYQCEVQTSTPIYRTVGGCKVLTGKTCNYICNLKDAYPLGTALCPENVTLSRAAVFLLLCPDFWFEQDYYIAGWAGGLIPVPAPVPPGASRIPLPRPPKPRPDPGPPRRPRFGFRDGPWSPPNSRNK